MRRAEVGPAYGEQPDIEEEDMGMIALVADNVQETLCRLQGMNNVLHALRGKDGASLNFFYWQQLSANNWRRAFCTSFFSFWGVLMPSTLGIYFVLPDSVHLKLDYINEKYNDLAHKGITAIPVLLGNTFLWHVPSLMLSERWQGWRHFYQTTLPENWRTYALLSIIGCGIELFDQDMIQSKITNYFMGDDEEHALSEEEIDEDLSQAIMRSSSKIEVRQRRRKWIQTGSWALTGAITASILVPFQVVMICVLSGEERYNTIPKCVNHLWQEGGIASFYKASAALWAQFWCLGSLGSIWFGW